MAHDKTRRTKRADAAASLYPSHTPGTPVARPVPKTAPAGKVAAETWARAVVLSKNWTTCAVWLHSASN